MLRRRLLDRVLEDLAGAELGLRAGLDLHRFAGARVAPGRGLAAGHGEIAESDEPDLVPALQRRGHDLQHRLDRPCRVRTAEPRAVCDLADEILLVHSPLPSFAAGLADAYKPRLNAISMAQVKGASDERKDFPTKRA